MACEFRKLGRPAVVHQPQPRFGVERHSRHLSVVVTQADDQIGIAIMAGTDLRTDNNRTRVAG